jgi:CubicO group peptidase (beta-lactamase class C family)
LNSVGTSLLGEPDFEAFVGPGAVCEALAFGWVQGGERRVGSVGCELDLIFDLASLTKPLAVVTTVALLLEEEALALDDSIGDWLPEAGGALAAARVSDLLHHRAGVAPYADLGAHLAGYPERRLRGLRHAALDCPLVCRPGVQTRYSDIGFILLAWICARAGRRVDDARQLPGLSGCLVPHLDGPASHRLYAPTGFDEHGAILQGRVHDPRCRAGGGRDTGHAGWFSTLEPVLNWAEAWLDLACARPSPLPAAGRALIVRGADARTAGFDCPTVGGSSGGGWSAEAFGHLGFTGTALWVDPARDRAAVLLTNRTWPDGAERGIGELRRMFFSFVAGL